MERNRRRKYRSCLGRFGCLRFTRIASDSRSGLHLFFDGSCRHIVRTVVAYQKQSVDYKPGVVWNPGNVTDQSLRSFVSASSFTKAKSIFDSGVVVELDRTGVPFAKIHGIGTVHFPVPNDIRYARVDCKGALADQAIAIAVLHFG